MVPNSQNKTSEIMIVQLFPFLSSTYRVISHFIISSQLFDFNKLNKLCLIWEY
jgi:hypothetical protein